MGTVEVTFNKDQRVRKEIVTSPSVTIGNLQANLIVQGPTLEDNIKVIHTKLEVSCQNEVYEFLCVFAVYDSKNKEIDRSEYILAKTAVSQSNKPEFSKTVIRYEFSISFWHVLKIQCNFTILDYVSNPRLHDINNTIFEKMKFADVNFRVQGKDFSAHKTFLTSCSKVFEAMFDHPMAESKTNNIIIDDISPDVFHEMLRFIYTSSVTNLNMLAMELFGAADKYQLEDLKKVCEHAMIRNITVENACDILLLADRHNAATLKSSAIEFINSNAQEMKSTLNSYDFNEFIKSHPKLLAELYYAAVD